MKPLDWVRPTTSSARPVERSQDFCDTRANTHKRKFRTFNEPRKYPVYDVRLLALWLLRRQKITRFS